MASSKGQEKKVTQELFFLETNYFYIGVILLLTQLLFGRSNYN